MNTEELLEARGKVHGNFSEHARITQAIKDVMRGTKNWSMLNPCQREALEMNAHKVGRILAGDPDYQDHWDDIAGYAKLVSQRLSPPLTNMQRDEIEKIAEKFAPDYKSPLLIKK